MEGPLERPLAIPDHEQCSLDERAIWVAPHKRGQCVRFGPGPEVHAFPRCKASALQHEVWAIEALILLTKTLSRKDA